MSNTILGREVGALTFTVDDVVKGNRKFASQKINERLEKLLERPIEACHDYHTDVCYNHDYHPLLAAVYTAYCRHLPLCLGPDVVWLTISQGIAHHMALHGERLRRRFVQHDGKLELTVEVDGWVPRSPENPWSEAFEGWTGQIKDYVGKEIFDSLMCDFSTTDSSSRIASQIVMMDIFETYFKYRAVGICGIPSITLEGTEADWEHLTSKVRSLRCFDIDWWLDAIEPLVDVMAESRRGNINVEHWRNICKLREAYGGDQINGWIAFFFPYLREAGHGPSCRQRNRIFETGVGFSTLSSPTGLSQVPFAWRHVDGNERLMNAVGGLVGVTQDAQSLALKPIAGWAVCEASRLDSLIFEIKARSARGIIENEPLTKSRETEQERNLFRNYFPDDLDRLFLEFENRVELAQLGSLKSVFFEFPSAGDALEWNEKTEKHSFGPFDRSWFKIAKLNDSRFLAINLDPNSPGRSRNDHHGQFIPYELRGPICVCTDTTVGSAHGNPVVALSFSELLEGLLFTESPDGYFWESSGFNTYGEANELTRVSLK